MNQKPNIILILADDMGFSDLGCFGSEIKTPNLDKLANNGLKFSQMYNTARCCPSRASLLTGVYPHQAGIGHMVGNYGVNEYQGYLTSNTATIAEVLRTGGYRTQMSGKWHVGGTAPLRDNENWNPGDKEHPTPNQRGFDYFWGTMAGGGNYFSPKTLMDNEKKIEVDSYDFYYTEKITDHAVKMIDESAKESRPFFSYVAYTAPHWPLHAKDEDIDKYKGVYSDGWDDLRKKRYENLKNLGIIKNNWDITDRDKDAEEWESVKNKDWEQSRMEVYAAQIDNLDQGVGRIVNTLEKNDIRNNTIIMFLSDNGGCAEYLAEDTDGPDSLMFDVPLWDGTKLRMGNNPNIKPGGPDTFQSYDIGWSNASNTPFRLHKRWVHEGGISTPFIINWPDKIKDKNIIERTSHIMDISATIYNMANTNYPTNIKSNSIINLEGESFYKNILGDEDENRKNTLFWEHEGNKAVRKGKWKLVCEDSSAWELYDMDNDRTEINNLSNEYPDLVNQLHNEYIEWSKRIKVLPWPIIPDQNKSELVRKGTDHIHEIK
ncbi:MAG: arylsulfatase [Dehalococcoidia bacterium]